MHFKPIGDLNGDNAVNSTDYALMKRHLLGIVSDLPVADDLWAADVNGDEKINSTDYALMRRCILGIIVKFPKDPQMPSATPSIKPTTIPTTTPTSTSLDTSVTITNGTQFRDASGNIIHALGGSLIKYNGYYYWYGEYRDDSNYFLGVRCYRSTDLKNWEYRGEVLNPNSASELKKCNIAIP